MPVRLQQLLQSRARSSRGPTAGAATGRRGRGAERCAACGTEVAGDGHAVQLTGGVYHARCVLYRPREVPTPPRHVETTR